MVSILLTILISTYPWPMRSFGSAHQVSATLGDARGDSLVDPRFHRGIDIPAVSGTYVYSIISDTARCGGTGDNRYVQVGDYWYIHIDTLVYSGQPILGILDTINTPPDTIGKVLDYPPSGPQNDHLHFQIGNYATNGPYFNPLSYDDGPVGYTDNGNPIVSLVDFWRQGSEGTTPQT